ncbi:MAG: hypothetical protein IT371_21710 [Deltaproteobacteria bacterium]|nr:hypothetical protein [Deltaproteobacteria bacterium]
MPRDAPSRSPSGVQRYWRKLRVHYQKESSGPLPRRKGDELVFRPSGYRWRVRVTLTKHPRLPKPKQPFEDPHPALGWPLVSFSMCNADDGYSQTSATRRYLDPTGRFTLEVVQIDEDWQNAEYIAYVAKVVEFRKRRAARRARRKGQKHPSRP